MRALVVFFGMLLFGATATAQYDYNDEYGSSFDGPDRYFYEDNFDWRWDIRVRITDGMQNGNLTRREADRLFDRLERIERKEYTFQSDGYFSAFEQDEIWDDVVDLNRRIGIELRDWDRTYYGYSARGLAFNGYLPWYFGSSYDFYRFDRRGYGSISFGYRPRAFFPRNHVYYRHRSYTSNWNNWNRNDSWNRNDNWNRNNNWNRSTNRDRDWNNGNRSRTEDRNNNRNNIESRGSRPSDGRSNSGSWGNGSSRNNTPSTSPRNEGSRTQSGTPSTSSRGRESNRREEIQTPRSSGKTESGGRTGRGNEGGRTSLPDRDKTNDSGRRGNNF
jgi:hypothetical protein